MHEIDSLNYVKLDLLGLNAVGLIDGACKLAGIDYLTPDKVNFSDENVINSIAKDTTLIFQFESGFASDSLKRIGRLFILKPFLRGIRMLCASITKIIEVKYTMAKSLGIQAYPRVNIWLVLYVK